ncbi:hypothetical protein DOY81_003341 [Sarcophaga bullata]|nr:hypothetical protein DOY81_003341 [Sarcophaga bullata]
MPLSVEEKNSNITTETTKKLCQHLKTPTTTCVNIYTHIC